MKTHVTPDMHINQQQKIREIEDEFGEPFWDVIQGFADMGYGRGMTAGIIGYDRGAFFRLVKAHGRVKWPAMKEMQIYQDWPSPLQQQRMQETMRRRARKHFVRGEWLCQTEISEKYGLGVKCVGYRVRKGITGEDLLKPLMSHAERGKKGAMVARKRRLASAA